MKKRKVSKWEKQRRKSYREFLKKRGHGLNHRMPKSERWFRELLEDYGYYERFKKNTLIYKLGVIPDYQNPEYKIVIEVDGSIHDLEEVRIRNVEKDKLYNSRGWKVFRVAHGDEKAAYEVLGALVEIFKKPSEKQLREIKQKEERKRQYELLQEQLERRSKPASPEEQIEAIQRILGTKKVKAGKFYE